jgi:predicted ATPase
MEPELLRIKGEFLLDRDDSQPQMAENVFTEALELARAQGAKSWELRTATSLAKVWRSQDREPEARELIVPIYEWFTEGFNTVDLKAAKVLVEQLS